MSGNRMNALGLVVLVSLALGALSGCGRGKEQAAVALDEARLNISSAKKAGAEARASVMIKGAQSHLVQAEESFYAGKYGPAKDAAMKAAEAAIAAESSARKSPPKKKAAKPRKSAKKK